MLPQIYLEVYEMSASVALYLPAASLLPLSLFFSKASLYCALLLPLPLRKDLALAIGIINFSFISGSFG